MLNNPWLAIQTGNRHIHRQNLLNNYNMAKKKLDEYDQSNVANPPPNDFIANPPPNDFKWHPDIIAYRRDKELNKTLVGSVNTDNIQEEKDKQDDIQIQEEKDKSDIESILTDSSDDDNDKKIISEVTDDPSSSDTKITLTAYKITFNLTINK